MVGLKGLLRRRKHRAYLEKSVLEMRSKICKQACLIGKVDMVDRALFLKYNNRLREYDGKK